MKKKLFILLGIFIVSIITLIVWAEAPLREIRLLEEKFATIEKGMTIEEVNFIMSVETSYSAPHSASKVRWNEKAIPEQKHLIHTVMRHRVKTFFMPVTFEFTFNDRMELIGKHIYD
mgnify:CR=1 FL=1